MCSGLQLAATKTTARVSVTAQAAAMATNIYFHVQVPPLDSSRITVKFCSLAIEATRI